VAAGPLSFAAVVGAGMLLGTLFGIAVATRWARNRDNCAVAGVGRVRKHRLVLPGSGTLPPLPLDIYFARPPAKHATDAPLPPLVVYVLDPEPIMFGVASIFAYAQAGYFPDSVGQEEAAFRRLHIVGVGHPAEAYDLDAEGFDRTALRYFRRRDFPPRVRKDIEPGGGRNKHAQRLVGAFSGTVAPFVESELLGFNADAGVQRALIGASYSAVVALQCLLADPEHFQHIVMGSPSVCFDMHILDEVRKSKAMAIAAASGVKVDIFLGARECEGSARPGKVHNFMENGARQLAEELRRRGVKVDGVNVLPGEDHTTMKLPLISRGLTAIARIAEDAAVAEDAATFENSPVSPRSPSRRT